MTLAYIEPQEAPLLTNSVKHSDSTCTQYHRVIVSQSVVYTEG